jgi:hypothetical protein
MITEELIKKWEKILTFESEVCLPLDMKEWQRHAEAYESIDEEWGKFDFALSHMMIPHFRKNGKMPELGIHEKYGEYYIFDFRGMWDKKHTLYNGGILLEREKEKWNDREFSFLLDDGFHGDPRKYGKEPLIYIKALQSIRGGMGTHALDEYLFAQGDEHRILAKERVVEKGADNTSQYPCSEVYYTTLYNVTQEEESWIKGDIIVKNRRVFGDNKKLIICEDVQ